jgi:hypothetical protein
VKAVEGDEPTRTTIAIEIVVYALLFALVGALFAAMRTVREGERVLNFDLNERK